MMRLMTIDAAAETMMVMMLLLMVMTMASLFVLTGPDRTAMPRLQQMSAGPLSLLLLPALCLSTREFVQQVPSRCEDPQSNGKAGLELHDEAICERYSRLTESNGQLYKSVNVTDRDLTINCARNTTYTIFRANVAFASTSNASCPPGNYSGLYIILSFVVPTDMKVNISVADTPQKWRSGESVLFARYSGSLSPPTEPVMRLNNTPDFTDFKFNHLSLYLLRADIGHMDFSINLQAVPNCTEQLQVQCLSHTDGKDR